jgi:hypothetical protein
MAAHLAQVVRLNLLKSPRADMNLHCGEEIRSCDGQLKSRETVRMWLKSNLKEAGLMSASNEMSSKFGSDKVIAMTFVAVLCLVSGGCSPELIIGGAIATSVMSAHLRYGNAHKRNTLQDKAISPPTRAPRSRTQYSTSNEKNTLSPYARAHQQRPEDRRNKGGSGASPSVRPYVASREDSRKTQNYQLPSSPKAIEPKTADKRDVGRDESIQRTVSHPNLKRQSGCGRALGKAAAAYQQLEWEQSAKLLRKILSKDCLSESETSEAYIFLGAIAYQQGSLRNARDYFSTAKKFDPNMKPSVKLFSPPMIKFYKGVSGR